MGYYPTWETPHYQLWDNGGRHPWEVFDLNCNIWRFGFSLTLWRIGNFSRFIKTKRALDELRAGRNLTVILIPPQFASNASR